MDSKAVEKMIDEEWDSEDVYITGFKDFNGFEDEFDLYLVRNQGVDLGCVGVKLHENESAEVAVYLKREFRRRGVGYEMTKSLHTVVKALGANFVWGLVKEDNVVTHNMLDKFGHGTFPAIEEGFVIRGLEL